MKITVNNVEYNSWGKCLKISNGSVEALVTLNFGPRIIRYAFTDGKNILFENESKSIHESGSCFDVFGENDGWYIYGGHRLWVSPEALPATYYPDNDPVDYEIIENGAIFTPKQQTWTNIQTKLVVIMSPKTGNLTLDHTVTNNGAYSINASAWALTVMSEGGLEIVPMPDKNTGLLHNRKLALWAYTKMNDPRVGWGEKYITLRQDITNQSAFKIGLPNEKGWAAYFNNDNLFVKRFDHNFTEAYPDDGMSYETYTNSNFLEMESLSPLKVLEPGQSVEHKEIWELYNNVAKPSLAEQDIDLAITKILNSQKA